MKEQMPDTSDEYNIYTISLNFIQHKILHLVALTAFAVSFRLLSFF